ncbi:unnamed protein product [Euphydryas editha]|uniref:PiggyBac transposable element-derived protein domain-containing protein n=1 Tax=Euphydryas editha TaxID=104508 RepID=A0AAU9UXU6_EUPED|nr:unnamed protein product [Euphydryas editha]
MHSDMSVGDNAKQKPDIISYYNKYKTSVDTMDQTLRRYTSQRRCSIWPMAMFFNILDIAALTAYLIYYENYKMIKKKTAERRLFLRKLSEEFAKPMIEGRMTNPQVMHNYMTKNAIEKCNK